MSLRTLFVGDVHGCSEELRKILDEVEPNRCILVGDMFRKGPDDLGVWKLIQERNLEAVLGNHDLYLAKKFPQSYPQELLVWIQSLSLWIDGETIRDGELVKWRVVHAGVNPLKPKQTTQKEATTLRRYPNDKSKLFPFWWKVYDRKRLVVYGHDAKRGLKDRRPKTLGLDTGCVYGNGLTGYVLEEDRLVHIPSQKIYVDVTRAK